MEASGRATDRQTLADSPRARIQLLLALSVEEWLETRFASIQPKEGRRQEQQQQLSDRRG